jgi:polyisoprenoid-binding protein YceI
VTRLLAALALAAMPVAALAATDSFTLDPYHSSVTFTIDHLGMATIHGRFHKFAGKFGLDRGAKSGTVDVVVETASVDTDDGDKGSRPRSRDDHLRSADFFNAAEFPKMTFKSTGVTFASDNPATIEGNLTLLGVTKPVKLTIERFKCNPATVTAKERCGGNASGKLKRSEFGMSRGIPSIGDEITLSLGFEGDKD